MPSLIDKFNDDEFRLLVAESISITDIAKSLGYKSKGGAVTGVIKKRIDKLSVNTSHFSKYSIKNTENRNKPLDEILVENSTYTNNTSLKKRLLSEGLKTYACEVCNISTWLSKPLSLQLDPMNGINTDNRLENLRLICPNCHSQTETFSGRNASHN
jgi:Zn finger protein HypA/HybF involved in hydrogenase expression